MATRLPDVKAHEAKLAIEAGAQELDMVIQIGLLRAWQSWGSPGRYLGSRQCGPSCGPGKNSGEGDSRNGALK